MSYPNHNQELTIYAMVRNRLPFLDDTVGNTTLISQFTLEVMYELEPCLRIRITGDTQDLTRVGDEANYSVLQRSLIADIVAIYIILMRSADNVEGSTGSAVGTFLSKAKAGSVEVEYTEFDIANAGSLSISSEGLREALMSAAKRKARNMGCIIDICDDCSIFIESVNTVSVVPFIGNQGDCGCK